MQDQDKFIADLEILLGKPLMSYQRFFIYHALNGDIKNIQLSRHSNKIPILEGCKTLGKSIDYIIIDEMELNDAP